MNAGRRGLSLRNWQQLADHACSNRVEAVRRADGGTRRVRSPAGLARRRGRASRRASKFVDARLPHQRAGTGPVVRGDGRGGRPRRGRGGIRASHRQNQSKPPSEPGIQTKPRDL